MIRRLSLALSLLSLSAAPAFAHLNPDEHGSLLAGISHPLFGLDHILAMIAVGVWAALLGRRSVCLVPCAFVATMVAGFAIALIGVGLPSVEPAIAASVVIIGLLALVALQVPTQVGMALAGFFAFFHGYAHGGELGAAGAIPFAIGFALSTAILHAIGVGAALGSTRLAGGQAGWPVARLAGGATALGGMWLALGG